MKKLLKNSVFRVLIMIAGDISLFIFLFMYIIPYNLTHRLTIALTIILFILIALIFTMTMVCELCYDEASKQLVFEGNLNGAYNWIERMHKFDILRWYRSQYVVFLTIYYRDKKEFGLLQNLLHDKIFRDNGSMILINQYNQFLLAIYHHDDQSVKQYFNLIEETYSDSKRKNDRIALVYSLGIIRAEKDLYFKNYKEVMKILNKVVLDKFNCREQGYYYYLKYCTLFYSNNKQKAEYFLKIAESKYPQGQFMKIINE